jgi:hypothetical protein
MLSQQGRQNQTEGQSTTLEKAGTFSRDISNNSMNSIKTRKLSTATEHHIRQQQKGDRHQEECQK